MKYDFEIKGDIGYGYGSKQWVSWCLAEHKGKPVTVRVNSLGGAVDHALDIAQQFRDHGDVTVYMVGLNASAATILAMGAKKIVMSEFGLFLIHKASFWQEHYGRMNADEMNQVIEELKKTIDNAEKFDSVIAQMYVNKCGRNVDEIKDIMTKGGWLTAQEVLELGLVDALAKEDDAEGKQMACAQIGQYGDLKHAYGLAVELPKSPKMAINQTLYNINNNMKKFFDSVLAWFGLDAMAEVTDEQMDGVLAQVEQKHKEMMGALDTANATIAERDQTIAEQVQTIEAHVATIAERDATIAQNATVIAEHEATIAGHVATIAERDVTIAQLNEQITALQKAPGAEDTEPVAQIVEEELYGVSNAQKMYDQIAGLI